ncbi:MAG: arginase family protein [Woeseiaceae bacterium]|nr:arginase family protein [Woeseiaceae bacterium]
MLAQIQQDSLALIGVPSSAGARKLGQEQGPRQLRAAGLPDILRSAGHDVMDLGDLPQVSYSPDAHNPRSQNLPLVIDVCGRVGDAVETAVENNAWPLVLGGDCSITIGVLAALTRHCDNLGMAYIDGDLDLNTPQTTTSGIFDGMVLGHVLGGGANELRNVGSRSPLLKQENITLFGYSVAAGGVDPIELDLLNNLQVQKYPREDIESDIQGSARKALKYLENETDRFLVHFDLDVIDFDDFPAVDVPHRPGLSVQQAQAALAVFLSSRKSAGLVVTEFNAAMDSDGSLARRLSDLLRGVLPTHH